MVPEPIDAETAVELYLHDRETELTRATINSHKSRLSLFVRWCDDNDIANPNTLTGTQRLVSKSATEHCRSCKQSVVVCGVRA